MTNFLGIEYVKQRIQLATGSETQSAKYQVYVAIQNAEYYGLLDEQTKSSFRSLEGKHIEVFVKKVVDKYNNQGVIRFSVEELSKDLEQYLTEKEA